MPFHEKDEAKRLGAKWDAIGRGWWVSASNLDSRFEPWLPLMFKPEGSSPVIVADLVPSPCWRINLRSLLPQELWQRLRRECADLAGNRCRICGGRGEKWPVECDEEWEYLEPPGTPGSGIQKLKKLTALCPTCHSIKHLGKAQIENRYDEALRQLCLVNGWTEHQSELHAEQAFFHWERRSTMSWEMDLSTLAEWGFGEVFVDGYRMNPVPTIHGIGVVLYPTYAMVFNNVTGAVPTNQPLTVGRGSILQ